MSESEKQDPFPGRTGKNRPVARCSESAWCTGAEPPVLHISKVIRNGLG